MTEDYKEQFTSRIKKLNFTNHLSVKKALLLCALCLISLSLGFFAEPLIVSDKEKLIPLVISHFCGFFKGTGTIGAMRSAIAFAFPDMAVILFATVLGYTMLSGILGKITIVWFGARLGFCFKLLYDLLISDPQISSGKTAFILFCVCKLSVCIAVVFSIARSELFSYEFGRIFERCKHPFIERESIIYLKSMASTAGFSILLNIIYLIFQGLQSYTPI